MKNFELRFPANDLQFWSEEYIDSQPELEDEIISKLIPVVTKNGYLSKEQFLKVCQWKTQRTKSRCQKNDEQTIVDITGIALSHPNEKIRIEILTLLKGVQWPTASVFLHFFQKDKYPILDFRALWSLGVPKPPNQYDFDFWWDYVIFCRKLATDTGLEMRIIDRALWAYSNENQKP